MKGFRRNHPEFSLCGLSCALCPMRLDGHCPGCGGGDGQPSCGIIRCSREHGCGEFCSDCAEFPCERLERASEYDSFISHRRQVDDLRRARALGLEEWLAELARRQDALRYLLAHCNDGRRKRFFCTAACLLEAEELEAVGGAVEAAALPGVAERAALAAALLREAAGRRGVELKLRKKPKAT